MTDPRGDQRNVSKTQSQNPQASYSKTSSRSKESHVYPSGDSLDCNMKLQLSYTPLPTSAMVLIKRCWLFASIGAGGGGHKARHSGTETALAYSAAIARCRRCHSFQRSRLPQHQAGQLPARLRATMVATVLPGRLHRCLRRAIHL
eukprot:scaffold207246_cov46-Prasinocladus_malaysianus.AAC.2